jgi:glycosyltransferase involved in cell wall biosynthesis
MRPRVSVLVNNYNYGRFLDRSLESALAQDFPASELEIIVVDDASTDDSRAVIERHAPRVQGLFLPKNGGQAAAFNAGFAAARGEILCLLDADDWWAPTKVSRVVAAFDRSPELGLVQHPCHEVSGEDATPPPVPTLPERHVAEDFLAGRATCVGTTGMSFRASALRSILPVPETLRICADGYLFYVVFKSPIGNLSEGLGYRRFHGTNGYVSRYGDPTKLRANLDALSVLEHELERILVESGRPLWPELRRQRRFAFTLEELLLARYQGRVGDALSHYRDAVGQLSGRARTRWAAALLVALASPGAYLELLTGYAKFRARRNDVVRDHA